MQYMKNDWICIDLHAARDHYALGMTIDEMNKKNLFNSEPW